MRGNQDIIACLNELLVYDLCAMETYLLQSKLLADWGYDRLAKRIRHEADDEMLHVEKQMERLIYLGSVPDLSKRPVMKTGTNPKEMIEIDLELERHVSGELNKCIELCDKHNDAGTRKMLDELLYDTEMDHVLWLESQLTLIQQLGLEVYLAEQLK